MKTNLLIIFAKKPEIGKNKTRIALETDRQFALDFSINCLKDLISNVSGSIVYNTLIVSDTKADLHFFAKNFLIRGFSLDQIGTTKNLDQKFRIIFNHTLSFLNYHKVILIPMDVPYLTKKKIESCFQKFSHYQVVLGPERNGGVYLIGLSKNFRENLFQQIRWSTPHSFQDLILYSHKQACVLNQYNDLNTFSDILTNKKIINKYCPYLSTFLKKKKIYS